MVLGIPKRALIILAALIAVIVLYAVTGGELSSEAEGSGGESGSGECTMVVDADALNVRSGPSTGDPVVDSLEQDSETEATGEVRDGFRKLAEGRWAADDFLQPADGSSC
ncbi:SH3 domain-containing protein [Prauserella rugosa]|uniref:SH3 domain-containing protein n=1 Tax=Prauserella rugosa TaxID=43354 RepID=A0A660CIR7_9PSEU|nr:SH3 domain-containing protein [Prauserella rugosa]KID32625.1 hypothetical protein HQ32_00494 [Prauserella sp. Am3]TWH22324.1 hypothetical protein JD82_04201 [Prauserella rugosa]